MQKCHHACGFSSADGQICQELRNGGGLAFPRQAPLMAPWGHGGPVGGRLLINGCNEASQWLRGALLITRADWSFTLHVYHNYPVINTIICEEVDACYPLTSDNISVSVDSVFLLRWIFLEGGGGIVEQPMWEYCSNSEKKLITVSTQM